MIIASSTTFAIDTSGLWQGPCQIRGAKSVKFKYEFIQKYDMTGIIHKEKQYFLDTNCSHLDKTSHESVSFALGNEISAGIYELDVYSDNLTFYNIVSVDGNYLIFADQASNSEAARPSALSRGNRVFFRMR